MEITIGAKDYFNELKLMEVQCGQEEDLNPWVYMLLQQAKHNKSMENRKDYQQLSIRHIPNLRQAGKNSIKVNSDEEREKFFQTINICFEC